MRRTGSSGAQDQARAAVGRRAISVPLTPVRQGLSRSLATPCVPIPRSCCPCAREAPGQGPGFSPAGLAGAGGVLDAYPPANRAAAVSPMGEGRRTRTVAGPEGAGRGRIRRTGATCGYAPARAAPNIGQEEGATLDCSVTASDRVAVGPWRHGQRHGQSWPLGARCSGDTGSFTRGRQGDDGSTES